MTQAPYQQAAPQTYQPQGPAPQQGYYQPQAPAPQGYQPPPQNGGYQPQPAPYQQAPQQGQYQPQGQQNGYQPVAQPGPVQGTPQAQQQSQNTMQAYQPSEDGSDPMLEDFTVFRGAAPYLSFSDPACTGYERGGTILAVGTDFARKYKTNDPLFWEYGPKKGQQRMCRVLIVQTKERIPGKQDDTGIRTLELMDGKNIFKAAAMAVRSVNPNKPSFEVGGQIYITRTGTQPSQGGQDAVTYSARYIPAPADYVASDQNLMMEQTQHQANEAPSAGAQQLQQAAAYVASTPNAPVQNTVQPQYQATPPAPQGQAPWMQQGPGQPAQVPAPATAQAAPWQAQGQPQAPPWQQQSPGQPMAQQAPPWQQQSPQSQAQQQNQGHPFGPSPQQPMQSPYPPQQ